MPIYEYECPGCQTVHEVLQKFSDAPMETCPQCGGQVKKLVSQSSFHLKGGGWYNTDYRKPKASASEKAETTPVTPNPSKPKAS